MKKVYALAGAFVFGSTAMAQLNVPIKSAQSVLHAGSKYANKLKVAEHPAPSMADRGTPYYYEDFENGFTGNNQGSEGATGSWTVVQGAGANLNVEWEITSVGHANDAGSTFNIPALNSTTGIGASGSWALLDSDSDGSSGSPEESSLISPTIDLTNVTNNALALEWQQFFAEWQADTLHIGVSSDGGTNFTEFVVSDGVGRDNRPNPEVMRLDLTSLALSGENDVVIRFRWTGNWDYGWQVDDVVLVDLPDHNINLASAWATHTQVNGAGNVDKITYTKIPTDQVFDLELSGNVQNLGAQAQTGVTINMVSGAYSGSTPGIALNPSEDSTIVATTVFNPGATVQAHEINYAVTYGNVALEDDLNGLLDTFRFEVTDSEFSRDRDDYTGAGLWNGDDGAGISNSYVMGHAFQIESNVTMDGISAVLTGSTDPGVLCYGAVYSIDPGTGEFTLVAQSNDVEVKSYMIPTGNGSGSPQIYFPVQTSLVAGETYIICVGHYGGPDAVVIANSTTATASANTTFLLDGTDNTWYYLTSVPMIRLHLAEPAFVGVDEEIAGVELGQNVPNPFNGASQISYSLDNGGKVSLQIVDVTGKIVANYNEGTKSAGTYNITVNADQLAAGVYYYTLTVDGTRTTKRMVVSK